MPSTTVELRNIAGTEASVGWARAHTVVVDRPDGKAGDAASGSTGPNSWHSRLAAVSAMTCVTSRMRPAWSWEESQSRSPLSSKAIQYSRPRQPWSSLARRSTVPAPKASSKKRRQRAWLPTHCVADYQSQFVRSVRVLQRRLWPEDPTKACHRSLGAHHRRALCRRRRRDAMGSRTCARASQKCPSLHRRLN